MPAPSTSIDALVAAVQRGLSTGVDVDSWAPTVQGAVGHVVGLCAADGTPYVLKTYRSDRRRQAATEVQALRRFGRLAEVPVPAVHLHGHLPSGEPRHYVLMERLPGVRWADRRADLRAEHSVRLHRRVGRLLRRLHVLSRRCFGDMPDNGPRWPDAWAAVDARCERLVERYRQVGGPVEIARRIRRLVDRHHRDLARCSRAVLCHNDLIDSNLLVTAAGEAQICGVVDLERASWGDPLADLARTKLHARYHDPVGADALVAAYGVRGDEQRGRLIVHEALHALEERTWITMDLPERWQRSVAALDEFLRGQT